MTDRPSLSDKTLGWLALAILGGGVILLTAWLERRAGILRNKAQTDLEGAEVLASRSEIARGEWQAAVDRGLHVKPMGSVAYKLSLVAGGLADATWTLVPKHEWDVAAGVALVVAAGGEVWTPNGAEPRFNKERPRFDGLLAAPASLAGAIRAWLA